MGIRRNKGRPPMIPYPALSARCECARSRPHMRWWGGGAPRESASRLAPLAAPWKHRRRGTPSSARFLYGAARGPSRVRYPHPPMRHATPPPLPSQPRPPPSPVRAKDWRRPRAPAARRPGCRCGCSACGTGGPLAAWRLSTVRVRARARAGARASTRPWAGLRLGLLKAPLLVCRKDRVGYAQARALPRLCSRCTYCGVCLCWGFGRGGVCVCGSNGQRQIK